MAKKKEKKKKSLIRQLSEYIVSILCLLLCLYIAFKVAYGNIINRPPKVFNLSISYVPTESMSPTIESSNYILFSGISIDNVKTGSGTISENHLNKDGDIIVYYNSYQKKFIVHRVVSIGTDSEGKYLITQGDNNQTNMTPDLDSNGDYYKVRASEVCGKYLTTLTFMSIFSGGVDTKVVFIIIIAIFVIMIAIQVVSMVVNAKRNKLKEEKEEEMAKLKEELKAEILKEELEKLRNNKKE